MDCLALRFGAAVALCTAVGCVSQPDCLETATALRDATEVSELGFSAQQAMAAASEPFATQGEYMQSGGMAAVTLELVGVPTNVRLVDSRVNPRNTNDNVKHCEDHLAFDVAIGFRTDDGRFDGSFESSLRIRASSHSGTSPSARSEGAQGSS